jgi:glycosyltransferase involved in cell wall biosynthesis
MLSILEIYPFKGWGGPANHVFDLIKGFKKQGHNIFYVASDWEGIEPVKNFCQVYQFQCRHSERLGIMQVPALAKIVKENKIDIIHTHGGWNAWVGIMTALVARRGQVVNTWHGVRKIHNDPIHRWFYKNVAMIAVSEMLKKRIVASGVIQKLQVIHNGIDTERFTPVTQDIREKLAIPADAFVAGFFGRVAEEKGVEYAVEAINSLPGVYLMIVGGEESEPEYSRRLRSIAGERVKFCGRQEDVVPYMSAIDVLVLPTVAFESFGLVVAEAMTLGKPAIVTNTGGQAEIVTDGLDGYVIAPRSAETIAEKVRALAADKELYNRLRTRCREKIYENFSLDVMAQKTAALFERIIAKNL